MAKQQYITPSIAVTGDTTGYMNVLSTTPGGEVQIVTTGATVNTIGPDRYIMVGDMLVAAGHYKAIPTNLYVDGDISIQKEDDVVIGGETVTNQGVLKVDGEMLITGDINIQGDLIFEDAPSGSSGMAGSSGSSGVSGTSGTSGTSPASLYYKTQFVNRGTGADYTSGRMMGWGFIFTNPVGTKALINMTFYVNGSSSDIVYTFRSGTGDVPARNATATGTTFTTITIPHNNSSTCITMSYVLDGLTPGTQYWVDATAANDSLELFSGTFTSLEIL
jgi:hypothetical protein